SYESDQTFGEPAACGCFLDQFDDWPRETMRQAMLAEVGRELAARFRAAADGAAEPSRIPRSGSSGSRWPAGPWPWFDPVRFRTSAPSGFGLGRRPQRLQFLFPPRRLGGLAPGLVQPHQPRGGFGQPCSALGWDVLGLGLEAFVALQQDRLRLGVLLLADQG